MGEDFLSQEEVDRLLRGEPKNETFESVSELLQYRIAETEKMLEKYEGKLIAYREALSLVKRVT